MLYKKREVANNFNYLDMDINNKNFITYDFSEDEVTLSNVTMLGAVIQWQPRAEDIKEVCLETPYNYNIAAAIYDSNTFHDRYSYSLLNMWSKQLWVSGFWANKKNYDIYLYKNCLRYVL